MTEFTDAIQAHISDAKTQITQGTYRGRQKVTHFYNPETGLWVARDEFGEFVAGWQLGKNQATDLLETGNVQ